MEKRTVYKSKVDWWVYALLILVIAVCLVGPLYGGDNGVWIILPLLGVLAMMVFGMSGVKYEIRGNQLGVRNLYRWTWVPVDKIAEVRKTRGGLATAAMSADRVSIYLSDRNVLRSSMPIIISPENRDEFIADLKSINPDIVVK